MGRHGTTHWDVAAYALGVLEPEQVLRCEAHLAECEACAAELDDLLPTTKVLADVDLERLRQAEESQFADRLVEAVKVERHRTRRRRRLLAAAGTGAATVVTGVALLAGATWLGEPLSEELAGDPIASVSPSASPDGGGGPVGDLVSATDPVSGVRARVGLSTSDWGTQVTFELSSLTGPLECQLQVVRADDTIEVLGSWRVPEEGYGTEERPQPLLLEAPTATSMSDIAEVKVLATAPDGSVTTLVTVPV